MSEHVRAPGASQNLWGAYVSRDVGHPRVESDDVIPLAAAFNSWKQAALELGLKGPGTALKQSALLI